MEFFSQLVLGKVIEELTIKPTIDGVKKQVGSNEMVVKRVISVLELIEPAVRRIKQSSGEGDRPKEDSEKLVQLFEKGAKLLQKYCRSHWVVRDWIYTSKMTAFYESLTGFFSFYLPLQQSQKSDEILARLPQSGHVGYSGRVWGEIGHSGGCHAPKPPAFVVGLDLPMGEVKRLLFKNDASLVVVTAPGGCGKTTLVQNLCQDPDVKGKFKDNIFYVTVSKVPNIKLMVRKLFEHNHLPVPEFENDDNAINQLKQLLENQAQKAPVLLVLDDVWGGPDGDREESEFPLHKFVEFKIPECKILVTSRYKFPRVGSTYTLKLLGKKQAKELLRYSAFLTDGDVDFDDVVNKMVEKCGGFPLALEVVGGSLRGSHVQSWRSRLLELSEGQPLLKSGKGLLDCLQCSLAPLKAKLKDCFMDLGSYPDDKKIPLTALIDIWAELYKLDDNGVHAFSNLHKLSLQNLLNLVVTRKDTYEDGGWYDDDAFVLQHDLLRELAIHQSSQEPMEQRNRLVLDLRGNNLPDWWTDKKQPCINARLLSISTDEMFNSSWCNIQAPEVEVLILNFQTSEKHFTLPEFMKKMDKLKALVVTNYGFSIPELTNFSILHSLSSLKRIRLERVSIPTLCSTMVELKNLEKISLVMSKINQAFNSCAIQITAEILPNLKEINVDSCNDLVGLPEWFCDLAQLRKLSITNCHKPSALPEGIGRLKNLEVLRLNACTKLVELRDSIVSLNKLSFLDISGCSRLRKLPQQMGNLCSLRKLNMRRCSRLRELPLSIMDLSQLDIICDPEMARQWEVGNSNTRNEEIIDLHWLQH